MSSTKTFVELERGKVHNIMNRILEESPYLLGNYVLCGSSVIVLHGLQRTRPMGDLDIFCSTRTWFALMSRPGVDEFVGAYQGTYEQRKLWEVVTTDPDDPESRCDPPYLKRKMFGLEVNIFCSWRTRTWGNIDINWLVRVGSQVDGLMCTPIDYLYDWKIEARQDKDVDDIRLLCKYLKGGTKDE